MNTIVTEMTEQGEMAIDVFQKLASDRILFISGQIDSDLAADVCATLLLKDGEDSNQKITIFINSPGGNIRNVLAIYDMISILESPVETVCVGSVTDEAIILLIAGTPGMRLATKHSFICVGQLVNDWMMMADLTDAKIALEQLTDDNKRMLSIIAKHTNKTLKQVTTAYDRKVFMNSDEALKNGFIDKIITESKKQ